MKTYKVKLSEELSNIYEDIAKVNHKTTEECLSIILERVIRTMLHQPGTNENKENKTQGKGKNLRKYGDFYNQHNFKAFR